MNFKPDATPVGQSRMCGKKASTTIENLPEHYAKAQQPVQESHLQQAAACAAHWNAFHAQIGSFADQYIAF